MAQGRTVHEFVTKCCAKRSPGPVYDGPSAMACASSPSERPSIDPAKVRQCIEEVGAASKAVEGLSFI
jgi:hypothetical protein